MVLQKHRNDLWPHHIAKQAAPAVSNPMFQVGQPFANHEQTRSMLVERVARATRYYKQAEQKYRRAQARAHENETTKLLADQAKRKAFFAKREMFSALKRLEVFESQTTQ